ncbi:hypothetical protein DL95DRAFT_376726 [Leptodontidium sp. 2 PMI_412]|nr:hypothetical protein DL95DRAFT_376726 [Leptodontidium sp. 2 PMI_412]
MMSNTSHYIEVVEFEKAFIGKPHTKKVLVKCTRSLKRLKDRDITRLDPAGRNPLSHATKRHHEPSTTEIRETGRYHRSADLRLSKLQFSRLIREAARTVCPTAGGMRCQSQAIQALQEASEAFLMHLFDDTNLCALMRRGWRSSERILVHSSSGKWQY